MSGCVHRRVQWLTWEGMQYRLYCLDCGRWLEVYTQTPQTLEVFEYAI